MKLGKNPNSISAFAVSIIPPTPGQTGRYLCRTCGERFKHKVPLIFAFGVKCPKCGSLKVLRDPIIVH